MSIKQFNTKYIESAKNEAWKIIMKNIRNNLLYVRDACHRFYQQGPSCRVVQIFI